METNFVRTGEQTVIFGKLVGADLEASTITVEIPPNQPVSNMGEVAVVKLSEWNKLIYRSVAGLNLLAEVLKGESRHD